MNKNEPDSNVDPPPALEKGTLHGLNDLYLHRQACPTLTTPALSKYTLYRRGQMAQSGGKGLPL